ncbi:Gm166, partial [Symbiodinium microadriaticum]
VDPATQPELAHIFRPSEQETAEAEMRRIRSKQEPEDEKAALIKQRVEEGVKKLMEQFEEKLRAQDEKFQAMLSS